MVSRHKSGGGYKKDSCGTEGAQEHDDLHNSEMEEAFEQLTILIQQDRMLEYPWNCVGKACGTTSCDDKSAIAARGA